MPGQPVRTRARFRMSLAIHPRELPAATSVTAIIVQQAFEKSNVFAATTLLQKASPRNLSDPKSLQNVPAEKEKKK